VPGEGLNLVARERPDKRAALEAEEGAQDEHACCWDDGPEVVDNVRDYGLR
jgi:hypothetical protein